MSLVQATLRQLPRVLSGPGKPESREGRWGGRRAGVPCCSSRYRKHNPANYLSTRPGTCPHSEIYSWDSRKIYGSLKNNKIVSRKLPWAFL